MDKDGYIANDLFIPKGYQENAIELHIKKDKEFKEAESDLSKLLNIDKIYFDFDSYKITKASETDLQKIIITLEQHPEIKLEIRSHTDGQGTDTYNLNLSEQRAQATKNYLIKEGIDKSRLKAKGFGKTHLLENCEQCTKEQHAKNRRSEFIILN